MTEIVLYGPVAVISVTPYEEKDLWRLRGRIRRELDRPVLVTSSPIKGAWLEVSVLTEEVHDMRDRITRIIGELG